MRRLALLCLAVAAGCSAAGANAVVNTAIGAAAAGARRANGECYTPCTPGNVCNPASGMCEPLPCRGECQLGESCEQTPTGDRCVPAAAATPLEIRTTSSAPGPRGDDASASDAGMPKLPPSQRLLPRP